MGSVKIHLGEIFATAKIHLIAKKLASYLAKISA